MTTATLIPDISTVARHVITVSAQRNGRFKIELDDRSSPLPASRTPLLSTARYLLGEGANPDSTIQMRHAGKPDVVAMSGRIGTAAKLDVNEDGPRFRKWRPFERFDPDSPKD